MNHEVFQLLVCIQFTVLVFMEAGALQIQIYSAVTLTNQPQYTSSIRSCTRPACGFYTRDKITGQWKQSSCRLMTNLNQQLILLCLWKLVYTGNKNNDVTAVLVLLQLHYNLGPT